MPKQESKTLLLKIPLTGEHEEGKRKLNWKLHSAGWLSACQSSGPCRLWRTVTNIPAWLWTLCAKILTYQVGCVCLCSSGSVIIGETNSPLMGFMDDQNREFTSGIVSQDNNLWLGRSWSMGKLLLLLYYLDVIGYQTAI